MATAVTPATAVATTPPGATAATDGATSPPRRIPRTRLLRLGLLALVWAVSSLFYAWTATSASDPFVLHTTQSDFYNQLTDGFLRGELSIPTVPPPALVHQADPYNPFDNGKWQGQFHDLSLYHGHLYLSWGPTPVVTLLLPWRALGEGDMPLNLAGTIYASLGLAFALLFLEELVSRYRPGASILRVGLAGVALGASSVVAYLLRRPDVYEIAIASAYCFVFMGLYFLAVGALRARLHPVALGIGSLCLGIAIGGRFEMLVLGALIALVAVVVHRRSGDRSVWSRRGRLLATVLPWCAAAFAVLAYNFIRFGNPLQIGSAYQMAGFDPTKTPYEQPGYLAPSLYYYFFAPVHFTLAFPYVNLPPPTFYTGNIPETYRPEVIGGLLSTTPILLFLLVATFVLRGRFRELGWIVASLSVMALVFIFAISLTVPGGTMRYEADFASLLLLGAVLTWIVWSPRNPLLRGAITVVGAAMILLGTFIGTSIAVTGPNDEMAQSNGGGYQQLQNDLSFIPTAIVRFEGAPRVVRIIDPLVGYPNNFSDYGTFEAGTLRFTLLQKQEEIDIMTPSAGVYELTTRVERTASAPPTGTIEMHFALGNTPFATEQVGYGHLVKLKVAMSEGLNRMYAWATFKGTQPQGAYPDIVNVYGLHIAKAD